jgi:hypothetical protein
MGDEIPIPDAWRLAVSRILRRGDLAFIQTTFQSNLDWEATFPEESWNYIRFEAMAAALSKEGVLGKRIADMREAGETYAFWFHHHGVQMYGKINLLPNGEIILVYSTHPPRRGKDTL